LIVHYAAHLATLSLTRDWGVYGHKDAYFGVAGFEVKSIVGVKDSVEMNDAHRQYVDYENSSRVLNAEGEMGFFLMTHLVDVYYCHNENIEVH